jgi:hypothetical protein
MRVRFTRRPDGRHRLSIVRDDGTVSLGQVVPGFGPDAIPHDLLHTVVEKTLGLRRGVYGLVNTGLEIAQLLDPARKSSNRSEIELMHSEIVTSLLQAESVYGSQGVDDSIFPNELRRQCSEAGLPVPAIAEDVCRALRVQRDDYEARWRRLGTGQTLEVDLGTLGNGSVAPPASGDRAQARQRRDRSAAAQLDTAQAGGFPDDPPPKT